MTKNNKIIHDLWKIQRKSYIMDIFTIKECDVSAKYGNANEKRRTRMNGGCGVFSIVSKIKKYFSLSGG